MSKDNKSLQINELPKVPESQPDLSAQSVNPVDYHLLQTICDSVPDAVWVKDLQGRYVMINAAGIRFFKKPFEDIIGKDDTDLFTPETARAIMEKDRKVVENGQSHTHEEVVAIGDVDRAFLATRHPYRDVQGEIIGLIGISRDITSRKHIDEELQRSNLRLLDSLEEARAAEQRFRELLEAAPDAIVGVNADGQIALVNTQTEKMFGYHRDELIGQPVERLLPARLHDTHMQHRHGYITTPLTRPMGTGLDLAGRRKDGTEFPVELSLSPMETDEGLLVTSIIRDITDRKQLEEQLRRYTVELEHTVDDRTEELRTQHDFSTQVIDQANSIIMVLSSEGKILLFNRRCEETTGYAREEIIGHDWTRLLPEEAHEQGRLILSGILDGRLPDVWESPIYTKNGAKRTILWRSGVIHEGDSPTLIVTGRDVTEQRRLQEQVLQSERLAAVGRMAAQVAHEIRNPLSSIGLNIELLFDEIQEHHWEDSDEAQELIRIVLSEIERLNGIIHDYLLFARMPVKQVHPESVNDLVNDLVKLVKPEAQRAQVKLTRRLGKQLPDIEVDSTLVGQALLNCVQNAIEAMPWGGKLSLSTRAREECVELSIKDTGSGIRFERQSKVFDPFYTTKDKGTGLGLPYVRQIVNEHGGQVSLDSTPGVGTTVIIRFPIVGATSS